MNDVAQAPGDEARDAARQVAKHAAKEATLRWVRSHPRQTLKAARIVARHPHRASQVVSEAQTVREAVPDPRVQRLGRRVARMRNAHRSDLAGTVLWAEMGAMSYAALMAYAEARERRARRVRRRRALIAIAGAAALVGVGAIRRAATSDNAPPSHSAAAADVSDGAANAPAGRESLA